MYQRKNLTGKNFGRLTALSLEPEGIMTDIRGIQHPSRRAWICRCSCGTELKVRADRLLSGKTKSCGCLLTDIRRSAKKERAILVALSSKVKIAIARQQHQHPLFSAAPKKSGADSYHGLPMGTYALLLAAQDGRCFICRELPPGNMPLHLDHDHITQQVRGLLCNGCNTGLGLFRDNPMFLTRAAEYLVIERPVLLSSSKKGKPKERNQEWREQQQAWKEAREKRIISQAARKEQRKARELELARVKEEKEVRKQLLRERREQARAEDEAGWLLREQKRRTDVVARREARRAEKKRIAEEKAELRAQGPAWTEKIETLYIPMSKVLAKLPHY